MTTSSEAIRYEILSDPSTGRRSLLVETDRDGSAFDRLSKVLVEAEACYVDCAVLFLAVLVHDVPPNRLVARKGVWPPVLKALSEGTLLSLGESKWIPSDKDRSDGAFIGLARVSERGLPGIFNRLASGGSEALLLGPAGAETDLDFATQVYETTHRAGRELHWHGLGVSQGQRAVIGVKVFGAFDDRVAAIRFSGPEKDVESLYARLSALR